MVDFQMKNHDKITTVEEIIANFKQQSQRNQNGNVPKPFTETESCVNKNSTREMLACSSKVSKKNNKTQSDITNYFTVVKNALDCNNSTTDTTIWSILHTLKTNKESGLVATFEDKCPKNNTGTNRHQTHNYSFNRKIDNNLGKSSDRNIMTNWVINDKNESARLTTSTEVVRKTHSYREKQNNKRLKLCDNDKNRKTLRDFFNVDYYRASSKKTVSDVEVVDKNLIGNTAFDNKIWFDKQVNVGATESKSISGESFTEKKYELIDKAQFSNNSGQSRKPDLKNSPGKVCGTKSWQRSHTNLKSKEKTEKPLIFFKNFKVKNEQGNYTEQIQENKNVLLNNKENLPVVCHIRKIQSETTFDDFCKNIVTVIGQSSNENKKMETGKGLQFSNPATDFLLKSHSTSSISNLKSQKDSRNDLSSLPRSDIEIKIRKDKLVQGKISLDDFIENIVKDLSGSESNKRDSESTIKNIFNSKETSNFNIKSRDIKTENLIESLKIDKQVDPQATYYTSIYTLSNCSEEKLYQCEPQKTNIGPESIEVMQNNLEMHSVTNSSKSCNNMNRGGHNLKLDTDSLQCGEQKGSESEDFLSYFSKNWNKSCQFLEEPSAELLIAKTDTDCNKCNDSISPTLQDFPLNVYNEYSPGVSQDDPNVVQVNRLTDEKENGYESDTHCTYEYPNFTESNTYYTDNNNQKKENTSEGEQPYDVLEDNLLQNGLLSVIVSDNDRIKRDSQQSRNNKTEKLDDFLEKLLKQNTFRHETNNNENNKLVPRRTYVKRYRKGKTKIYRLSKLKKRNSKTDIVEQEKENLNFDDIFKKITQDVWSENSHLQRSKSMSSISTSSSYITDVTRSEILSTGSNELSSPKQRLRKGFNELCKDKSLLCCEEQWENTIEYEKEEIKKKIQHIIMRVAEDFSEKNSSSLKYRKQSFGNCIFKDGRLQLKPMAESSMTVINSKTQRSQPKFTIIIYLLKKIQNLLETDTKLTKRELYYQLKTLIRDQQVTDRAINAISCLLNVGMWALNIVAQKGLVFGNLKILLSSGETLNCNIPGTLIPQDINDIVEIASPAYFILVVEKESIFFKLIEEDLPNRLTRPFIMITGKGFPDLNTQLFLKKLWMIMSIPVFIMVDADPHGINIMLNYRFGSVNNAHVSHQLAVPNAKWLGVYPSEVINLNITRELLSERELKLVNQLLKTPYMDCNPKIVRELKVLLETKCKAEIEGLMKSDTYLSEVYLPNKFFTHNFI